MAVGHLRSVEANLLSQRAGVVWGGYGMWLTAESRAPLSLKRSEGAPFVIPTRVTRSSSVPPQRGLPLSGHGFHGAYTRWFYSTSSRASSRAACIRWMSSARYIRVRATRDRWRPPVCECVSADAPTSNGVSVDDRVGCAAFVPGDQPFCYVRTAECRDAILHPSEWRHGAYWMSCDALNLAHMDNSILVSSNSSEEGVVAGAVCPAGHRYMTMEECLVREDPCGPGEMRSESTLTCVASIFGADTTVTTWSSPSGTVTCRFSASIARPPASTARPPTSSASRRRARRRGPEYAVQRGTRRTSACAHVHYDRLGASDLVRVDLRGCDGRGQDSWLAVRWRGRRVAARVRGLPHLTDEQPHRVRLDRASSERRSCRCPTGHAMRSRPTRAIPTSSAKGA